MATPPQAPRDASPIEWAELATLLKANAEAVGQLTEQVQQLTQALEADPETEAGPKVTDEEVRRSRSRAAAPYAA